MRYTSRMADNDFDQDISALQKDEVITDLIGELKSGKEATVYLAERCDGSLVAVKHYRTMYGRGFATSAKYREGRFIRDRDARALAKRSRWGRHVAQASWIAEEFRMMRRLFRARVPVPRPIAMHGASIVMQFVPEAIGIARPASRLIDVELTPDEALAFHKTLMRAIITMLSKNIVHADLSAYNILVTQKFALDTPIDANAVFDTDQTENNAESGVGHNDEIEENKGERVAIIIDFPQAVDPRFNHAAHELLSHDIEQITKFLAGINPEIHDTDLADRLWNQFRHGKISR